LEFRSVLFGSERVPDTLVYLAREPFGKNLRTVLRNRDRVLEMRRKRPVGCHHRPRVRQYPSLVAARIDHRLDRKGHARAQDDAPVRVPMTRDVRLLPHLATDAVPAILAHHAEACRPDELLDRVTDRTDSVARPS